MVDFPELSVSSQEGLLTVETPLKTLTINHLLVNAVDAQESFLTLTTKTEKIFFEAGSPEFAEEAKKAVVELVR